ncbi:MAG: ABC transporter ATP-binding protein [Rhodocyclaceae bacterium]|jgi:ABC-type polysaccharide/polyol phosphate transport system ATPase subunit|nr:ABC transporter ATP-binding protein [Rhodocyclaceae bacterium]
MAIIEVDHVTKEFQLGQLTSLKQAALNTARRLTGRPVEERKPFKALDDISFSVEEGEVLGIIGHNGAGKSTLLKLLANISKPTRGSVRVHGKVAPLIEVGAGLVGDLTGRENIYLNGSILGISKAEINRKFDDIVAFAELEEFIDTPIKRYSSGMQVRLGFSIATSVESDILIVDEVLAVGDLAFQRKCMDRIDSVIREKRSTVLLVTHNIRHVERICSRAILMDHGQLRSDGEPNLVCNEFYQLSEETVRRHHAEAHKGRHETTGDLELVEAQVLDADGLPTETIPCDAPVTIRLVYEAHAAIDRPVFGVGIQTPDFLNIATTHSVPEQTTLHLAPGRHEVRFSFARFPLMPGVYCIRTGVAAGNLYTTLFYAESVATVRVEPREIIHAESLREGFIPMEGNWSILPTDTPSPSLAAQAA